MTAKIARELMEIFIMVYAGLSIGLLFWVRDRFIARCSSYRRLCLFIYFGTWICAAFLFYRFLYKGSHGVLTVYGIISAGVGILLWKKVIYGIIIDRGKRNEEEKERENTPV